MFFHHSPLFTSQTAPKQVQWHKALAVLPNGVATQKAVVEYCIKQMTGTGRCFKMTIVSVRDKHRSEKPST